jgi:hypothetical protein
LFQNLQLGESSLGLIISYHFFYKPRMSHTFRSHINSLPSPSPLSSHILNRPPVSGVLSGIKAILLIAGVGKVRNNSVWIHVALGALP